VGYMKVYDPGYEAAKREVGAMDNIRFIQVNHLHPHNDLHTRQFHVQRFVDVPDVAIEALKDSRIAAIREAIGNVPDEVQRAFYTLAGSMIHDIYGLRTMLGNPSEVVSTELWHRGRGINVMLAYPNGARCVATWIDLPDLWDFHETLEVYGDDKRVLLTYPCGFARGILADVTVHDIAEDGSTFRKHPALDWETAFSREMRHFHACVQGESECRTPVESARDDVSLIIDIIRRYTESA
jgi:predicted dehydrogenase